MFDADQYPHLANGFQCCRAEEGPLIPLRDGPSRTMRQSLSSPAWLRPGPPLCRMVVGRKKGIDNSSRNVCGEVTKGSPLWKIISQSTRPSLRGSATKFQTTYWKLPRLRELTEETTSQCIFVQHYIFAPALNHRLASASRTKFKVSNRRV